MVSSPFSVDQINVFSSLYKIIMNFIVHFTYDFLLNIAGDVGSYLFVVLAN